MAHWRCRRVATGGSAAAHVATAGTTAANKWYLSWRQRHRRSRREHAHALSSRTEHNAALCPVLVRLRMMCREHARNTGQSRVCAYLAVAPGKVWKRANIGTRPKAPDNLIISGAVHAQLSEHCAQTGPRWLPPTAHVHRGTCTQRHMYAEACILRPAPVHRRDLITERAGTVSWHATAQQRRRARVRMVFCDQIISLSL